MNRREFIGTGVLGCASMIVGCDPDSLPSRTEIDDDALALFRDAGVDGAFVLLDVRSGVTTVTHRSLASQGFLPASTFKIPNTIIGLETGVIPDASFSLKWDGVRRDFVESWNRDHDLASAMKNSVLWFYQEVARRIGAERMQQYLDRFEYGNRNLGGGIDRFWVAGDLRISPMEQVDFLRRLMDGELDVQPRNLEILRNLLPAAHSGPVSLRCKTGLTEQGEHKVGWLVGFVERPTISHYFASMVLGPASDGWRESPVFKARRQLPMRLLERAQVIPPMEPPI